MVTFNQMWEAIKGVASLLSAGVAVTRFLQDGNKKDEKQAEDLLKVITGRMLFLLRYIKEKNVTWPPGSFDFVLAEWGAAGSGRQIAQNNTGWKHAAGYASFYLTALGLVEPYANHTEIRITELGKAIVTYAYSKGIHGQAFDQQLPP